jgi:ribonuclease P protein component
VRLTKRSEYLAVQGRGRKVHSDHFLLLVEPGQVMRIGVTVSSRVGNAVVRNRVKRFVREYLRRHREAWPAGRAVIVAKPSAATAEHAAIDVDLARLLARARGSRS